MSPESLEPIAIGLLIILFLGLILIVFGYRRARSVGEKEGAALIIKARKESKDIMDGARAEGKSLLDRARAMMDKAREMEVRAEARVTRLKQTDKEMVARLRKARELLENLSDLANGYAADIEIVTESDLLSSQQYQKDRKNSEKVLKSLAKDAIVGAEGRLSDVNIDKFVAISAKADMAGALLVTTVEMLCAKTTYNNGTQVTEKLTESLVAVEALVKILDSRASIARDFKLALIRRLDIEIKYKLAKQVAKEAQRELREREREEAKARKEAEKARQEAEHEEAIKQKALEELQAIMAQETEAERAAHSEEMARLQAELEEARQKAERAKSRAQETRQGHVYIISNVGSFGNKVLKIGMTRRLDPLDRVKELGDASVPFAFDVHAMIESDDAPALESKLHQVFNQQRVNKVNLRKEYFYVSLDDIELKLSEIQVDAMLNRIPSADEYYQSLKIEKLGLPVGTALPDEEFEMVMEEDD